MKKIENPPNPFDSVHRELLEPANDAKLEIYEDTSRSILSANDSPDVGFTWSVNPYRGCFHSCAYCYARRYHEYWDMGAGTDFESKLGVKLNAPDLLRAEFTKKSWKGETVIFSGATDCYQPIEAVYGLTQSCLKICRDFHNPIAIITKSFLVTRDLELIKEIHQGSLASVTVSIPFATDEMAKKIEPQASSITRRFKAVEMFAKAGVPVGVSLAPTIPGLNEGDMPIVMKRAKELGASYAFHSLVRLSGSVRPVFEEKIKAALPPERVERILHRIQETRGGKMNNAQFGQRMRGKGIYWKSISDLFRATQKKYGLINFPALPARSTFRVPTSQMEFSFGNRPSEAEPEAAID